jgi:AcrR family transcriptional regulator
MSTEIDAGAETRVPLTRERVLSTAVALADQGGIESLSMRKLAHALDVVPMALYRHVANKEELLDGLVDVVVGEIESPTEEADWKTAIRERILSARRALLRHPWAYRVLDTRKKPTPAVLEYMDRIIRLFRAGGFSVDLTHHAMHAMGSRLLGYTQELMNDSADTNPTADADMFRTMADLYPNIAELVGIVMHDDASVVGAGCDDQFEFEFALDLMLDGLEERKRRS